MWHGSDLSGDSAVDGNCDAWNSESVDKRGLASTLVARGGHRAKLLDQDGSHDCRNFFVVLCVEITPHSGAMFSRKRRSGGRHPAAVVDDEAMTRHEYERLMAEIRGH